MPALNVSPAPWAVVKCNKWRQTRGMPLVQTPTRRAFLQVAGAAVVVGLDRAYGQGDAKSTHWALLSDTHIPADAANEHRGFRPVENLSKIAPDVAAYKPDGIVISGDLARLNGQPGDYERLRNLLEPTSAAPVGFCLGNHDDRKNFLATFSAGAQGTQSVSGKHVAVIERAPVRLVLLDSLMYVNQVPGLLGKAQRAWLDGFLAKDTSTPTLLFVHHTLDDSDGSLLDADRFLQIAARHRNVKAVFYGHSHRYAYDTIEGMHLVNLPAVGYNFNDAEPVGWVKANFTAGGADLELRAIGGNTSAHGKTRSLEWRG